jgi:broad specificity phosphatase PhoE
VTGSLLLVRHGETEWNLQRRYQGRSDSPLTERGVAQAHAIGRLLETLPETAGAGIIASPLGRARRTAALIREHLPAGTELRFDDRLRELSLGSWDGLTYQEIATRAPGVFDGDGRYQWYFRSPDGEPYDAFAGRLTEWLHGWSGPGVRVVVTHGIVTRVLRGLYAGLPHEVALMLPVPQDKVFRLSGGFIEEFPVLGSPAPDRGEKLRGITDRGRSR